MKFGFRKPSLRGRISARTSWKRYARHSLGLKAPRGWGWLTNPRKAAYYRTTIDPLKGAGCMVMLAVMLAGACALGVLVRYV